MIAQIGIATGESSSGVEVAIATQRLGAIYLELKKEIDSMRQSGPHKISKEALDQVHDFIRFAETHVAPYKSDEVDNGASSEDVLTVCIDHSFHASFTHVGQHQLGSHTF